MASDRSGAILAAPAPAPRRHRFRGVVPSGARAPLRLAPLALVGLLLGAWLLVAPGAEADSRLMANDKDPTAAQAATPLRSSPLQQRLQQWPQWHLPAPLSRPAQGPPSWPSWFAGEWQVESESLPQTPDDQPADAAGWRARFVDTAAGSSVADRAGNALAAGRSLLGPQLLAVQDDPANAHRQLARLAGNRLLETTLIGQRAETAAPGLFFNDELTLQVLHGPGDPRVSRIETLGRWQLQPDGSIEGEQWQARYASPASGLKAAALASGHWRLRLVPVPPGSDRANQTEVPAAGDR